MTYRAAPDFLDRVPEHVAGHQARIAEFSARGVLLLIGPLAEPVDGEAMGVFTTREAAEEFAGGDPFVRHGVVAEWRVRAWDEVLGPDPA